MIRYLLAALFWVNGCAHLMPPNPDSVLLTEIDLPLTELRSYATRTLPIGPRGSSPNGRELYSKHFVLGKDRYLPANDAASRYYAKIFVLGDRRPYNVEFFVVEERRVLVGSQFTYSEVGQDRGLADELARKLKYLLSKRREDRNIIDDFRVF